MTATPIDGKALSRERRAALAQHVAALADGGLVPCLVAVSIGDDPAWAVYQKNQRRACHAVGITYRSEQLDGDAGAEDLFEAIERLNADDEVHGIIIQSPLPEALDERSAQALISPDKDVEAVNPANLGLVLAGRPLVAPCTAVSAVLLAEQHLGDLTGVDAVVIGASVIVGRPVAQLLLARGATVTICHIDTKDLSEHVPKADLVVVAVGKPGLLGPALVKPGATVIDVGINRVSDGEGGTRIVGDVDSAVWEHAGAVSPVPGGVGSMTTTVLLEATVAAAERLQERPRLMAGGAVARILGEAGLGLSGELAERIASLLSRHVAAVGAAPFRPALERRLGQKVLVLDGAMGTELRSCGAAPGPLEWASLNQPDLVLAVHRAYVEAGAEAITTNTFQCNRFALDGDRETVVRLAQASVRLARQAAGSKAFVLGSIGPLGPIVGAGIDETVAEDAFAEVALAMADAGVDGFIGETLPNTREACALVRGVRRVSQLPVLVSRSLQRDHPEELRAFAKSAAASGANAVGINCAGGPRALLPLVKTLAQSSPIPVFALPNAGFPTVDHGIATYHLDPAYLVRFAAAYLEAGVALIGGCCGVGPAHIAALVEAHAGSSVVGTGNQTVARSSATMALRPNPFIATLGGDAFPVLAMVPGHLESRVAARTLGELAEAGADAIGLLAGWPGAGGHSPNLPARLRHLRDACSKPAILELPAASVSLAEAQAALRDAHLLGIDLVLIDVGVFSGMAGQPGSGADPARLVQLVADCNRGIDLGGVRLAEPTTFAIGVRLGVDDLDLAETLAQAGAQFCTLQPVYEPKRFRDALAAYAADLPLLAEILVLPDADTAEELDAEVPVLSVPRRLVERLAEDPDEDVRGVLRFLGHWRDRLAGVCLMLPDERSEQAAAILEELRR